MSLIKERIGKLISDLEPLIYPDSEIVEHYRMIRTKECFKDVSCLDTSAWEEFDQRQIWGGHREYYWFETCVTIPERFAGKFVVFEVKTGAEGGWDANNPQFTIYVNGERVQGLDVNHREIVISRNAEAQKLYRIVLSAFTGDSNFSLRLDSRLKVLDPETEHYYYDLSVPYNTARLLDSQDQDYIRIIQALNSSLNLLDLREEASAAYRESLGKAQKYLTENFYEKYCDPDKTPVICCIGHTHIDVAWLWTLSVTRDKAVRSFSTMLSLMKEYPEFLFMSSQPQLYAFVKKNAPDVYEQIRERVKEGRWEPEGAMWLEADCNLTSGESLVRQILYGKRFFKEEFGVDNKVLWLPDVFGYSAALPQILLKSRIPYFMTTKISWNEKNMMPYDTFMWEGIDGSRVLTHFVPTRDYKKPAQEGGTETEYFTTYNGFLNPSQMKGAWARYSQKDLNEEVLCSFGYGDGGGGPTREQLENQRRMAKGIPGLPRTEMMTVSRFFELLDTHTRNKKNLPTWAGELYLEYHRGTYTSMARNKKYNRRTEFALENEETFAAMDAILAGGDYPGRMLYENWIMALRNQFHDILPGSGIFEIYEDSKAEYKQIAESIKSMRDQSLGHLAGQIDAECGSVIVFHPNSTAPDEAVFVRIPEEIRNPVIEDGGRVLPVQRLEDGRCLFTAPGLPSKGYKTFTIREMGDRRVCFEPMKISKTCMENHFFAIDFNDKGQFARIYDKTAGREILKEGKAGNVIVSYEDRPHNYDAWDLNDYYTEKAWEIDEVESAEVLENGPVRGVLRIARKYLKSTIVQDIILYAQIARIDIVNRIEWKQHNIFLKDHFPVDVHTNEAVFEIQYGNVVRPTHSNTSWDDAKFEVCHHKWLDLAEDGYGISFLNDCKFGVSVRGTDVGLSMLKSAVYPNPQADKEYHEFTYSIYPHQGSWKQAGTAGQAYQLNNPSIAFVKSSERGLLPSVFSLVKADAPNVVIESVKKAEDSSALIVRLYECWNRRGRVTLTFGKELLCAAECNLLEEEERVMETEGKNVSFELKPYEILTLKVRL